MGFAEVLTAIFIVLKLTHVVSWSWWWVVSPEIISVGFLLVVIAGFLGILGASEKYGSKK